jgi:hypothetical protein
MKILNHLTKNFINLDRLRASFNQASPAPLIVLDQFLPENIAHNLSQEIDSIDIDSCKKFTRNGSYMEECNDITVMPEGLHVINELHSQTGLKWLTELTGIPYLIPDPYLIGAGYSKSFRGDGLKNHIDFNWNDSLKLYRALTLIIYLSEDWEEEWGGHLEFSKFDNETLINKINIKWNRAVIWKHHETCFHGYPTPITCPDDQSRKTLRLFFYVSNQEPTVDNPAHRSLYWYDENTNTPLDQPDYE